MQVFELGKDSDFNIWIDPDVVLAPGMIDMIAQLPENHVGNWGPYGASSWFKMDEPFELDTETVLEPGPVDSVCPHCNHPMASQETIEIDRPRDIALAQYMVCVPRVHHSIWEPTELPMELALAFARRDQWVADWNISRNLAKLKAPLHHFKSPKRMCGAQHDLDCFMYLDAIRGGKNVDDLIDKMRVFVNS